MGRDCDREVGVIKTNSAYWVECMKTELQVLELLRRNFAFWIASKRRSIASTSLRRVARSEAGI
jgi:hypothetical protein